MVVPAWILKLVGRCLGLIGRVTGKRPLFTAELVDLIVSEAGAARRIAQALQFETPLRYAMWFAERAATGVVRHTPANTIAIVVMPCIHRGSTVPTPCHAAARCSRPTRRRNDERFCPGRTTGRIPACGGGRRQRTGL